MSSAQRFIEAFDALGRPPEDRELVLKAYEFARTAHAGQKRLTGGDYIEHPLTVATTLTQMKLDTHTIAAGFLHDVLDDTPTPYQTVEEAFGQDIAQLVEGITKLGKIKYRGMERYLENLRKMFVAMARDIRVILIKFADRLHNLKTIEVHTRQKQERIARETLEIYAPLANRLEMGEMRDALEDLSFKILHTNEYVWLSALVKERLSEKSRYIKHIRQKIARELERAHVPLIDVHGRTKHIYGLWKKLKERENDITKVYDLIAVRIVVGSVPDCYTTLGILHTLWKPLKGRIKDYIAQPKINGYQSLHTTVFCDNGEIVELQIRTKKMHEEAEYGVAAHWYYDERGAVKFDRELQWVRDLTVWHKRIKDAAEFLESMKIDVFQNRIFVFTPKGDVIDLPEGATPVDFAYQIHTDLGNQCVSAKVNDQFMGVDTPLNNGDVVEIIRDKNKKTPSMDWLESVKTTTARQKIRAYSRRKMLDRLKSMITLDQG